VITKHPLNIITDIYTTAQFECKAKALGNAEVIWKRVGSNLPITAKITINIKSDEITSILNIIRISEYYEGRYYCIIKNNAGDVTSNQAHLHVNGMYAYRQYVTNIHNNLLYVCM